MAMAVTYETFDGVLLSENRGGSVTEYVSDPLGSLKTCNDASGSVTYTAAYWPYGELRSSTGSNPSPWGFVGLLGYFTDTATRLYVRMRHYRPNLTRWLTVDPLWPVTDSYDYCLSSPIGVIDSSGHSPFMAVLLQALKDQYCRALMKEIYDLIEELRGRADAMYRDPFDLYKFNPGINPAYPDKGTWPGHQQQYRQKQARLKKLSIELHDKCNDFPNTRPLKTSCWRWEFRKAPGYPGQNYFDMYPEEDPYPTVDDYLRRSNSVYPSGRYPLTPLPVPVGGGFGIPVPI